VLVSSTVRDLLEGSGLTFQDRGEYQLKGLEGRRSLAALIR
jgi:class 3 adenylate cyclase